MARIQATPASFACGTLMAFNGHALRVTSGVRTAGVNPMLVRMAGTTAHAIIG